LLTRSTDFRCTTWRGPLDNPRVDGLVNRYRCLSGNRPVFKNESARSLLKILRDAGTVALHKSLAKQGLEFYLETKVTGADVKGGKATVKAETKDGKALTLEADRVLVAVGRKAYIEGLGPRRRGREVRPEDEQGRHRRPLPDERPERQPAIGDLIDGPMLAHKAEDEGVAVAEILAGKSGHVNYDTIPSVIYTWPEMASVGITEEQAKERGVEYPRRQVPLPRQRPAPRRWTRPRAS